MRKFAFGILFVMTVALAPTIVLADEEGEAVADASELVPAAAPALEPEASVPAPEPAPPAAADMPPVTAPAESQGNEEPPPAPADDAAVPAPATWASLGWQVLGYVVPVIGAFLAALIGFGIQWIRAKTADLRWQSVLDQLEDAIDTAVAAVQQVTVDALKKAAADGKLTDEEKAKAFADALAQVKAIIGTKGLATLQAALQAGQEALEVYLRAKIEAAVAAQKVTP